MKNILFYSLLVLSLILISCSNDDSINTIEPKEFALTVYSENEALENNKIPLEFNLSNYNIDTRYVFTFNTSNGYLISNRGQIFESGEEIIISQKDYLFKTLFFVPTQKGTFNVDYTFTNLQGWSSTFTMNYTIYESNFDIIFDSYYIKNDLNTPFTFNFDILEKQNLQDIYSFKVKTNDNISNVFLNDISIPLDQFYTINSLDNNNLKFIKNSIGKSEIEIEFITGDKLYKIYLYLDSN